MTLLKNEPILSVKDMQVTFSDANGDLHVLKPLTFTVERQEFVCVLGPSGCGKSTLLRVLGGLLAPTYGGVLFRGETLQGPRRGVGFVFQNANLMPWRTVFANIALPLEMQAAPESEIAPRVHELIDLVGLQGFADWLPRDLSGGMAQRVAIARALVHDPDVLLLDEPFGALDALTREQMGAELLRIAVDARNGGRGERKTIVMVTHAIDEAVYLADRVLVLGPRPATLRLDVSVDLPRPREENLRYTPHFGALAQHLRDAIG
jgi:NitT/TauT family transport system ATP-binding protein